jgi:hypothetical protein
MSQLENFLSTSIEDPKAFSIAFNKAAKEIRAEELGVDPFELSFTGDVESKAELKNSSIYPLNSLSLNEIPNHLKTVLENWDDNIYLYRGTRLPDNSSSFDLGGIHTTPQLEIANAYCSGEVNNSTGIGRLLNNIEGGFITVYKAPLSTYSYANFEYEDRRKPGFFNPPNTLQNLKDKVIQASNHNPEDFYIDSNDQASPALNHYLSLVNRYEHYESILPTDTQVHSMYYRTKSGVTKINPDNPKWDKLLARFQEASLRDFYEVKPLENLLEKFNYIEENEANKNFLVITKELIQKQKDEIINSPWECNSMKDVNLKDSEYINKRPYIKNSLCVGSAMDTKYIEKSEKIQKLEIIVEGLRTCDLKVASQLIAELEQPVVSNKSDAIANLLHMRQNSLNNANDKSKVLSI